MHVTLLRTLPGYTGRSGTSLYACYIIEYLTWIHWLVWHFTVCMLHYRGPYLDTPYGLALHCMHVIFYRGPYRDTPVGLELHCMHVTLKRTLPGYTCWSGTSLYACDFIEDLNGIHRLVWHYTLCMCHYRGPYRDTPIVLALHYMHVIL